MSAVSFELHQVTSIIDGPLYRVKNEILSAVGASPAAFVYKTMSLAYDHYAVAADMENFPDSYELAFQNGKEFYRQTSVQRDWATVKELQDDLAVTQARINLLANDMVRLQGASVVVDQTITISAGA